MKYLRRLVWFAATRLLIICCVLGVVVTAFYFAMNATNIYIILKDGMAKRAQVIMMGADEDLTPYFSQACMERDTLLTEALNGQSGFQYYYSVTGFDHRINLDWFWCWPWEDTARATVTERIPAIDGKLRSSVRERAEAEGIPAAPQWQSAQYSLILSRENGLWHIKNMTLQRLITDE